jgi:hypothetical protein
MPNHLRLTGTFASASLSSGFTSATSGSDLADCAAAPSAVSRSCLFASLAAFIRANSSRIPAGSVGNFYNQDQKYAISSSISWNDFD